jgi:hypothetical protein
MDASMGYYHDDYNERLHFDALEPSVRSIPHANNFKLPLGDIENFPGLRMRINIAPYTAVYFSTIGMMEALGFTEVNFDSERVAKRLCMKNERATGYISIVAENPPLSVIPKTNTSMFCTPYQLRFISPFCKITLSQEQLKSNKEILKQLQATLDELTSLTNVNVFVRYDEEEKMFHFGFPWKRVGASLHFTDHRLSERIGYSGDRVIGRDQHSAIATSREGVLDAEAMATALSLDTGMIAITLDSSSAINTYGMEDHLMGTLWPEKPGIFKLVDKSSQIDSAVMLPIASSGQALTALRFNVSTITQHSKITPLQWPIHSFVYGVLKGRF